MIANVKYVNYVVRMMKDGRFMLINENGMNVGMLFFSVCNDSTPYVNNTDFDYLPHDETGNTVVVDNMICKNFKKQHLEQIEEALVTRFPSLTRGVWVRDKENKRYVITHNRRIYHEVGH